MDVNRELSRKLGAKVHAILGQCFWNAFGAVRNLPELAGAYYVEGFIVFEDNKILNDHGWIELEGQIVEVTMPDVELAYFPVVKLSQEQVRKAQPKHKRPPVPLMWRNDRERWGVSVVEQTRADRRAKKYAGLPEECWNDVEL